MAFFGGEEPKPGVKPKGYDGSEIKPEEMGKTDWEVQWWREMKEAQEEMAKKQEIEASRADEANAEQGKILLYLFGFLLFGTFLVFLPGYLGLR
ncbi:unnamed protein product [Durusdinium trenchii]|uniref:Uncharacterized protein n=1 Tax=Durusdinium trenchii TaxID=1381693 RepID=A0ABP0S700_9DINO